MTTVYWEQTAVEFFSSNGTLKKTHGRHRYVNNVIYDEGREWAHVDFPQKLVLFLGWEIPGQTGSLLASQLNAAAMHHGDFSGLNADIPWVYLSHEGYTVIPVLTLKPDHEVNLRYINEITDTLLRKYITKTKEVATVCKHIRVVERMLPGYVRYHNLETAYTPPTLEERVDCMGLTTRFASFIGRRITG